MITLSSCKQVVIKVDTIPQNTPSGQPIYITGNFNSWDPGEESFTLELADDSNYYFTIPSGFGTVRYKFTRGDWKTVEKGICGEEMDDRSFEVALEDTVICSIESWSGLDPVNCPKLTIKIENIPENTPEEDIIALAGNLNSWIPDDASIFEQSENGDLLLTIDRPHGITHIDYKITRGDIAKSESDQYGNEIPSRSLTFGTVDTISIDIEGWADIPESNSNRVVLIIEKLPLNTYIEDGFFLACNLNSWSAGDKNYQFEMNKNGQWFYPIPRRNMNFEYKITRGEWSAVEVDFLGYDIDNRSINLADVDTVYIEIKGWKDLFSKYDNEITVILEEIPITTPENSRFYLTGNFNGWDPGKLRDKFRINDEGQYYVNIPRKRGELECKVTRGTWESAQIGEFGNDIPNFIFRYKKMDTVKLKVSNWKDKPRVNSKSVTIVINKLPENTPIEEAIYLAPELNGWNPGEKNLIFSDIAGGKPAITIPIPSDLFSYKITRGDWRTVETDNNFDDIENRVLFCGFADTVYIDIITWKDLD